MIGLPSNEVSQKKEWYPVGDKPLDILLRSWLVYEQRKLRHALRGSEHHHPVAGPRLEVL
jgi:hypothetical protein